MRIWQAVCFLRAIGRKARECAVESARMTRSDRYLFSELLLPFFIGTFALIMMMVGTTLYNLLESLLREKWPIAVVLRVLALNIPAVLVLALPVATALAVSLAVNRLARDNEITVLKSVGVSLVRAFMPILVFGIAVSGVDFYLSDSVVPWASKEQQNLQFFLDALPKNPIEAGLTVRRDNYTITFNTAQKMTDSRRRLNRIIIIESAKDVGAYPVVTTAAYADYEGGIWTITDAVVHTYDSDGVTVTDTVVKSILLNLPIDFSMAYRNTSGNEGMLLSYAELTRRAAEARRMGQIRDAGNYETERWFKLSLPAMCAVFAFCAPPFALRFSRGGSFTGILLSIVLVFVAWNTFLLMKYFALGGVLPSVVAAWATNALFLGLGVVLLRAQE